MKSKSRLGLFYPIKVFKYNNIYYVNDFIKSYLHNISPHFKSIVAFTNVKYTEDLLKVCELVKLEKMELEKMNIDIIELPYFETTAQAYKKYQLIKNLLYSNKEKFDKLFFRYPGPFLLLFSKFCLRNNKSLYLDIVGNPIKLLKSIEFSFINIFKLFILYFERTYIKSISKKITIFTCGNELFNIFNNDSTVYKIVSTTIDKINKKNNYSFNSSEIKLVTVSYIRQEKRIENLLEVCKVLKEMNRPITLEIIGPYNDSSAYFKNLIKLITKYNLNENIIFHGYKNHDEIKKIFVGNDVFVFSSSSEGTPRVIFEAMANGLPVISTNVGGISDMIYDGYNGFLVNPKDIKGMCDKILKIYTEKSIYSKFVENGYNFVNEHTTYKLCNNICKIINKS